VAAGVLPYLPWWHSWGRGGGPGGEIGFTVGGGVVVMATYSDVSGLWSLSNTCACRGWMDSWNFLRKSRPKMGVATFTLSHFHV
jgi:hypothetical protein